VSGECDECGEHALECTCDATRSNYGLLRNCGKGNPFQCKCLSIKTDPLFEGIDAPAELPEGKQMEVQGREER